MIGLEMFVFTRVTRRWGSWHARVTQIVRCKYMLTMGKNARESFIVLYLRSGAGEFRCFKVLEQTNGVEIEETDLVMSMSSIMDITTYRP